MPDKKSIDAILDDWPYDPQSVNVRAVEGDDGRDVIQLRIEMGLLQLEVTGRPDGTKYQGMDTFYDYLISREISEGDDYSLTEQECMEADREFVQFYHRRTCWLALRNYAGAVDDANHTLGLMDMCTKHSPDENWTLTHEQYRPFVLFHHTQAAALAALKEPGPEAAVQAVNRGLETMRDIFIRHNVEGSFEDDELVSRLVELRESLREQFEVGRTLHERLEDAIASEQYELAAKLRDELNAKGHSGAQ